MKPHEIRVGGIYERRGGYRPRYRRNTDPPRAWVLRREVISIQSESSIVAWRGMEPGGRRGSDDLRTFAKWAQREVKAAI